MTVRRLSTMRGLSLMAAALCVPLACCRGGQEASHRADAATTPSASPRTITSPTDAAVLSMDVAEQCLRRGQLALTSPSTMVQAVSEFHCALQGPPDLAGQAHRGLAIAYAELGEREKAMSHLESCLRMAPSLCDRTDIEARLSRSVLPSAREKDAAPMGTRP